MNLTSELDGAADTKAGGRRSDWTDERVALLKKLWGEGLSASQVARQVGGLTRNAVIGKVHRLGLAGREVPKSPRSLAGFSARVSRPRNTASSVKRSPRQVRLSSMTSTAAYLDLPATATILTLTPNACRWPIGDPQEADFGYCGRGRHALGPYCLDHAIVSVRGWSQPRMRVETFPEFDAETSAETGPAPMAEAPAPLAAVG